MINDETQQIGLNADFNRVPTWIECHVMCPASTPLNMIRGSTEEKKIL